MVMVLVEQQPGLDTRETEYGDLRGGARLPPNLSQTTPGPDPPAAPPAGGFVFVGPRLGRSHLVGEYIVAVPGIPDGRQSGKGSGWPP
jgi:hypothetical protein